MTGIRRGFRYDARLATEGQWPLDQGSVTMAMHYPKRTSKRKRVRQFGFRARMKTSLGRKMINRKRKMKRKLTPM